MGQGLTVTQEDLNRSKLLPPNWYPVEVKEYKEEPAGPNSKNPGSTNFNIKLVVSEGEYAGVPLYKTFSEVAPGFAVDYLEACLGRKVTAGESFDLETTVGKKLLAHVIRGEWQGKQNNQVDSFRPRT